MKSLQDWYRYVDEMSRPVRRGDETEDSLAWRPWMASREAEAGPEETLAAGGLPSLFDRSSSAALERLQAATRAFEDPTLYDELRPIRDFELPEFQAPRFEVEVPSLLRAPAPSTAQPDAGAPADLSLLDPTASEPETGEAGLLDELPSLKLDVPALKAQEKQRWELLSQIRSETLPQNDARTRSRETREQLVQRLLDPTLTLEETALFLGVCPTTVRRYTNRGQLSHFRTPGNQRRFRLSDVLEFLESRSSEIEADAAADREAGRQ